MKGCLHQTHLSFLSVSSQGPRYALISEAWENMCVTLCILFSVQLLMQPNDQSCLKNWSGYKFKKINEVECIFNKEIVSQLCILFTRDNCQVIF